MSSCGTTPMAARAWRGLASMSLPQISACPPVLLTRPARMLIRVDLPAPLGPSRPNSAPRGIDRSTSIRACLVSLRPLPL